MRGPERIVRVEQIADVLRGTSGVRADAVVLKDEPDGVARLYYGTYHRRTDAKTGKRSIPRRLRDDIEMIKQLGDPRTGRHYFLTARIVRVPTPDVGDPAWRLLDTGAAYSLQVAAFQPTDDFWDFKLAAAEYCKYLREEGYEAYYHHGEGSSVVTVGTFGEEAVGRGPHGEPLYSAEVLALQRDELLKYNVVNGGIYRAKNARGEKVREPSRLVHVSSDRSDPWTP